MSSLLFVFLVLILIACSQSFNDNIVATRLL